jgi:hypothetical protein
MKLLSAAERKTRSAGSMSPAKPRSAPPLLSRGSARDHARQRCPRSWRARQSSATVHFIGFAMPVPVRRNARHETRTIVRQACGKWNQVQGCDIAELCERAGRRRLPLSGTRYVRTHQPAGRAQSSSFRQRKRLSA